MRKNYISVSVGSCPVLTSSYKLLLLPLILGGVTSAPVGCEDQRHIISIYKAENWRQVTEKVE